MRSTAVILEAARTPFGRLSGALAPLTATTLAAAAIRGVLERVAIDPRDIDHAVLGQVIQAGVGQAPSRQATFKAGLADTVTGETVNKVCASGMVAIVNAARAVSDGDVMLAIAGGMESMTNAPYLLPQARAGYRFGDGEIFDAASYDALRDPYFGATMVALSTAVAREFAISREEQDAFALASHERAAAATNDGRLTEEIVPLRIVEKKRDRLLLASAAHPVDAREPYRDQPPLQTAFDRAAFMPFVAGDGPHRLVDRDEAIRFDASLAALARLAPLEPGGTITAGNAPGVNDGAAALLVADASWAKARGLEPLATIVDHATIAWEPPYLALAPALAIEKLLAKHGLTVADIAVWEINEAFAAVAIGATRRLGISTDKINMLGGAVALGHPVGASGARITASVARQLRRRGGGLGVAAICSGSGQGDAILLSA